MPFQDYLIDWHRQITLIAMSTDSPVKKLLLESFDNGQRLRCLTLRLKMSLIVILEADQSMDKEM